MKKLFLFLIATVIAFCAYANTCVFDGCQVSVQSETAEVRKPDFTKVVFIKITVSDKERRSIRIHVQVGEERFWKTVSLSAGSGSTTIEVSPDIETGTVLPVKLVQQPGFCY